MTLQTGRHASTLLLGGVCVLALAATVAGAAPGRAGATHAPSARHDRGCQARARARTRAPRRLARRRAHCPVVRRHGARHPSAGRPPAVTPPASGTAGTGPTSFTPSSSAGSPSAQPTGGTESGTPPGSPPPSVPRVQVTAVEYSFSLSRTTVPAGKVVLEFVNHGQDEHNLNAQLGEGALVGSIANTASEGVRDLEVELRSGSYTLFCSLPEHEQKGMKATLTVE